MNKLKGVFLDTAITRIARDMIAVQDTGIAVDVNETLRNLNEKHGLVPAMELPELQNDVNLSITMERGRKLKSVSVFGYGSYRAEPYVDNAVKVAKALVGAMAPLSGKQS